MRVERSGLSVRPHVSALKLLHIFDQILSELHFGPCRSTSYESKIGIFNFLKRQSVRQDTSLKKVKLPRYTPWRHMWGEEV
jgi:hypothetical protein